MLEHQPDVWVLAVLVAPPVMMTRVRQLGCSKASVAAFSYEPEPSLRTWIHAFRSLHSLSLRGMQAEMTGSADIAQIYTSAGEFATSQASKFLRPEDGKPYFMLVTKQDEYCFTGTLLLHVDGEKATSTKRLVKRFLWVENQLTDVMFETAGKVDRDCEIKFNLGLKAWSIDVAKVRVPRLP